MKNGLILLSAKKYPFVMLSEAKHLINLSSEF
jgi:hypothetical protein